MAHGTEEQRARWMPRILAADDVWCQLFSEPGAGSDLASLSTRAREERRRLPGDAARRCGRRTRPSPTWASRWCGPTRARRRTRASRCWRSRWTRKGVDVRPLRQMTGEREFNEVFLDDVEVPVENLIGPEHDGWRVANTTLANERGALVRLEGAGAATSSRSTRSPKACRARGAHARPARAPAARAVVDRRRDLPPAQRAHARPPRPRRGDRRGVEHREAVLGGHEPAALPRPRSPCSVPARS